MLNKIAIFILDANAIRKLSYDQIKIALQVYQTVITIEEVQFEVKSLEKVKILEIKQLSRDAFARIPLLMNNHVSVRSLVKYYENEGTADVALLAYTLTEQEISAGKLFYDEYYIVTDDNGLRSACTDLDVKWLSVDSFASIL